MEQLANLVRRAQAGDLDAYGELVRRTQGATCAVTFGVLRDRGLAEDAAQETYLRAFRRLRDLHDPEAFAGWLRRTAITVALNARRSQRRTFLQLDDVPDVPVLDDHETEWSDRQRLALASALVSLSPDDRRVCDRRYHGKWTTARLAQAAGVDEAAMRKRLQRIRDRLRKEIEMIEQERVSGPGIRVDFPAKIVELLARPRLDDLPENPVGRILETLRSVYDDCTEHVLPEIVDFAEARKTIGDEALYINPLELHRVDERRILRYDLTLPLLMTARYEGQPLRLWTAGKAYRACQIDSTHLESFHQAEVFYMDRRANLDPWRLTGQVIASAERAMPGRAMKIVPTAYAMCSQAWELEIDDDGRWFEVLAWGVYSDRIVRHLGGDPATDIAMGAGYGLERFAMLRYGIDDIRKLEAAEVA